MSITLSQGSGGAATNALINDVFLTHLEAHCKDIGEDAGVFNAQGDMACSTDSFVITPLVFPGGDIGKLSVCGSSNDVAMRGAKPLYLTLGFMLEEGLSLEVLTSIVKSIAQEVARTQLSIISADTKVLPRGSVDGMFINTTCIGQIIVPHIATNALCLDDVIIISAPIGAHGASIFAARENIKLESSTKSDCAQLYPMLEALFHSPYSTSIHAIRDATRGGLASLLHEWVRADKATLATPIKPSIELCIEIDEASIPISDDVLGICEILGLEATHLANEGVCVLAVAKDAALEVCKILRLHELGTHACVIGKVKEASALESKRVIVVNEWGGRRFLEYPQGELLPRIC